jgi:class 3 adenylate cyclase
MSMQPQYAAAPVIGDAQFNTPNAARDGTGAIAQLVVARIPGTRLVGIQFYATGTTTAGMLRIFRKASGLTFAGDGSVAAFAAPSWRLLDEVAVAALVPSATVKAFSSLWTPPTGDLQLGPFEQIGVATNNNEQFNAFAMGGHL